MTTIHRVPRARRGAATLETYRSLVEKAPLGVYRRNSDGTFIATNLMLARMLGYENSKSMLTLNFIRDICVEPNVISADQAAGRTRELSWHAEVQLRRQDGTQMTARITESPGSVRGVIDGFVENIAAQREAERKLQLAQRMEAIGQLAGGVAHDFNNIINLIGVYAELLAAKPLPAEQVRSHAEAILQGTRRGAWLTQQLLALGQSRPSRPEITDIRDLLRPFEKTLPQMLGNHVKCRIVDSRERAAVHIDPRRWEQVILNLVINARDSMPEGGTITITTRLIPRTAANSPELHCDYLELAVSDTGVGMEESTLLRVFEPYFTTKARGKGTGLGLTLVYKVVSESGGSVNVSSAVGKGTSVRILMPIAHPGGEIPCKNSDKIEHATAQESISAGRRGRTTRSKCGSFHAQKTNRPAEVRRVANGIWAKRDLLIADKGGKGTAHPRRHSLPRALPRAAGKVFDR